MDLSDRIAAAEADLNAALEHAQDVALARRQVLDALDDLRVYRNLLVLSRFGVPKAPQDARLPIPPQQRRRVRSGAKPPASGEGSVVLPERVRDRSGRFVTARGRTR